MAETRVINLEVRDNANDVQKQFENLRQQIAKTTQEVDELTQSFGENSQEVTEAKQRLDSLTKSYSDLNRTATDTNATFAEVYGELQPLTTRMGEAEDRLYELALAGKTNTQEYKDLLVAVSNYRKAQIQTDMVVDAASTTMSTKVLNAVNGVANAYSVAEGAAALLGVESEKLQETMVKLQAAMAISQGLAGLNEAKTAFVSLGSAAIDALKAIRVGLLATGIGVFIVALGTIVAYWDDIKEAVSGVSEEQRNLNALAEKKFETAKEELSTLDAQDNILKLQGKSEREILQIKIKKIDAAIELGKIELKNVIATSKAEEEAAIKNYNLTKSIVDFILDTALFLPKLMLMPIDMAIAGANKVSEALGLGKLISFDLGKTLEKMQNQFSGFIAGSLFNVPEIKAEGAKARKEVEKEIRDLENQRAGMQLAIRDIDKQARENAKADADKAREEELKKQKEHQEKYLNEDRLRTQSVLEASNARILQSQKETEFERAQNDIKVKANQEYLDKLKAQDEADKARRKANRDFAIEMTQSALSTISSITELFGKKSEKAAKRAFQINKAAQIASATIDTYKSATSAYASQFVPIPDPSSPIRGAIAAGVAVAAGLANIAKIASQKFEGGGSTGGGGVSAGGGGGGAAMAAPNFSVIGSSGVNQLAQLQQQPTRAYVVSGEVTSQQALDRNRVQNATL